MLMQLNVVYVNNYVKKHDVNVQKFQLYVKILFDMLLIINQMMRLWWVFNHQKIIHFVINNDVHYFKFALFKYHLKQMNSTSTKRLHYSLISKNRFNPSSSPHSIHPITIKSQSTILAEKYFILLQIIKDMRYDIRRSYAGSRTSMENLRKRIIKARTMVLQCKDLCTRREFDHCQILMQYQHKQ